MKRAKPPAILANLPAILADLPAPQCVTLEINGLAAVLVKLDRATIDGFPGVMPIAYRAECGLYHSGAVLRLVFELHDRPQEPYQLDTFLNPGEAADLALLRKLQEQDMLDLHFIDESNSLAKSKRIRYREQSRRELGAMTDQALEHNGRLARLDFPAAKAAMMRERPL